MLDIRFKICALNPANLLQLLTFNNFVEKNLQPQRNTSSLFLWNTKPSYDIFVLIKVNDSGKQDNHIREPDSENTHNEIGHFLQSFYAL